MIDLNTVKFVVIHLPCRKENAYDKVLFLEMLIEYMVISKIS